MTTATTEAGTGNSRESLIQRALRNRILFAVAPVAFVLDQICKYWIAFVSGLELGAYPPRGGLVIIPDFLNIVYAVNYGAAWGILQGHGFWLVLLAIAFLALIYIFRKSLELNRPIVQWVFGLIVGGILGNATDRILHGHVIDFIDVDLGFYRWPTFNIADSCIVVGTAIYVALSFFDTHQAHHANKS